MLKIFAIMLTLLPMSYAMAEPIQIGDPITVNVSVMVDNAVYCEYFNDTFTCTGNNIGEITYMTSTTEVCQAENTCTTIEETIATY